MALEDAVAAWKAPFKAVRDGGCENVMATGALANV
jgi:hypothetical protein